MDSILTDLRYGARLWRRNPGFTLVAVLTLALGIGANTTMFSVVNATLLRPLPFADAERLMTVWKGRPDDPAVHNIVSLPNYRDWKERNQVFEDLALFDSAGRGYNLSGAGEPEQVSGVRVTASFFRVLGVAPLLGRTFLDEEEEPGADGVVVLSHGLWTRRYGADPGLVGQTIQIDRRGYTVVGVMPPEFVFQFWSGPRQLWVPAGWTKGDEDRGSNSFIAIGRLKGGVSLGRAAGAMDVIGRALADEYPDENAGWTVRLVPMSEYGLQTLRPVLLALLAVVGFVLLIACVNVANLMLARTATRQRELAIRAALGAGRRRLLRQLLTESVLLALLGGTGSVLVAVWSTSALVTILPINLRFVPLRPVDSIAVDGSVLAFTMAVSCLSGILFFLAPAFSSTGSDLNRPLRESGRGATAARSRLRHVLVASEVALAFVVLAGAGVMIASLARLLAVDPGLDPRNVLVMGVALPQEDLYYGPPDNPRFCQALDDHVGSLPGVLAVSGIAHLPLSGAGAGREIAIEGHPDPGPDRRPNAVYSVACPGILRTLDIPLQAGREFTHQDGLGTPGVVLVNESMARRFWPGEDAIGKRFRIGLDAEARWLTVVGVFRDVRHWGLDSETGPSFLRAYPQAGWPVMTIVTRTASSPLAFVNQIKKELALIEPDQPVSNPGTMEDIIGASVSLRRFPMLLLGGFALLGLTLAAVGIAGVVGYSVVQRTQEIGIRITLGAQPRDILALVVRHSMVWTLAGLGAGLVASPLVLRLLRSLLYGVTPTDPTVLGAVFLLLALVAFGASYFPARRAVRVDPVAALRSE